MKGSLNHIELRIENPKENIELFRKLFLYFEFTKIFDFPEGLVYMANNYATIIVGPSTKETKNDRDGVGLNHFTIGVDTDEEVTTFIKEFMEPNNLKPLFGTPKERPDIMKKYYQVMFEMPGGLLLEVVHNSTT